MEKKPPYAHNSTMRGPKKPMNKVNQRRRAKRESDGLVYGDLHEWTKRQPCILADHPDHACAFYPDRKNVESHHVKSIGSGGKDENNTVPLCPRGHDEAHCLGLTRLCEKYHRDFRSLACEVTEAFRVDVILADTQTEE